MEKNLLVIFIFYCLYSVTPLSLYPYHFLYSVTPFSLYLYHFLYSVTPFSLYPYHFLYSVTPFSLYPYHFLHSVTPLSLVTLQMPSTSTNIPKACPFHCISCKTTKPKYIVSSILYKPYKEHKSHNLEAPFHNI